MTDVAGRIRNHFRTAFNLPDEAIERLTETSRTALVEGFAALSISLEASDSKEAARWAHSMKGTLLNAGLARMAEEIGAIERGLLSGNAKEAGEKLEALQNGLRGFLNGH